MSSHGGPSSSSSQGGGPSGRSPFPPARRSRAMPRNSFESTSGSVAPTAAATGAAAAATTASAVRNASLAPAGGGGGATDDSIMTQQTQQHSPFSPHGMLRFSPNNSSLGYSNNSAVNSSTAGQLGTLLHPQNHHSHHWSSHRRARFFENTAVNVTAVKAASSKNQPATGSRSSMLDAEGNNADNNNNNNKSDVQDEDAAGTRMDGIPLDHLRSLAMHSLLQSPSQAAFYASILYSKTGQIDDGLLLARAHLECGKYTACLRVLEESAVLQSESPWEGLLVASAALGEQEEWGTLIELLEDSCRLPDSLRHSMSASQPLVDDDEIGWSTLKASISQAPSSISLSSSLSPSIHPLATICWWRGQAYLQVGSGLRAVAYWKRALKIDSQCQQAWEGLLQRNLLTSSEAYQLVQDLDFGPDMDWLRSLYLARIDITPQEVQPTASAAEENMNQQPQSLSFGASNLDESAIPFLSPVPTVQTPTGGMGFDTLRSSGKGGMDGNAGTLLGKASAIQLDVDNAFDKLWIDHKLQQAPEVLTMAARRAYRRYDWKAALGYCESLALVDPTLQDAAFCYVATLVILGHKRTLFRLAHEWVETNPKGAQAWFAVGSYYFTCQRYHVAQRHFCRATRLDPQCTEAWIAFGCSFAACDESDQALASFRAAQRLSPGEHSSLLYMGMEYVRTNHLVLAQYFLQSALSASGGDPLCLHELGVLSAQKNDHDAAIAWFQRALSAAMGGETLDETVELAHDPYWEPTLFDLGHSFRKTRQFEAAALCYERCVAMRPDKFSTYAALGLTKHFLKDLDGAIEYYHQALSLKADDPISTEMLNRALEEQATSRHQEIFDDENRPKFSLGLPRGKEKMAASAAGRTSLLLTPNTAWSQQPDDSVLSEDMDVDMSVA